ncbi:MAG: hypothetical protein LBH64_04160 [Coriobacteriales bacterium]|jgi:hypothetical protein|nr:hypothetical protein [Coriobacteriales bacterium]
MEKRLAALLVLLLIAGMGLIGCGPSSEQVIREGLSASLDEFEDTHSRQWQEMLESEGSSLESVGINPQELADTWTEGFSYAIDSIEISGDVATAEITITCKQLSQAVSAATDILTADSEALTELTVTELEQMTGETILEELRKSEPVTNTITITCTKNGNTWSQDAGAGAAYSSAFVG